MIRKPISMGNTAAILPRQDTSTSVKAVPAVQKQIAPIKDKGSDDKQESLALYKGTIELVLSPPLSLTAVRRLNEHLIHLRRTHNVEVLNLEQSRYEGIKIKLFLHTPIKLVKILQSLPEVDTVLDGFGKFNVMNPERDRGAKQSSKRITVKLKK